MENVRRVPQEYKLTKHLRTYHICDLTHDLRQLDNLVAVLDPVSPEMLRMIEVMNSVFALALMQSSEVVSKDVTRHILVDLVKKHLGIGQVEAVDEEQNDQAAVAKMN